MGDIILDITEFYETRVYEFLSYQLLFSPRTVNERYTLYNIWEVDGNFTNPQPNHQHWSTTSGGYIIKRKALVRERHLYDLQMTRVNLTIAVNYNTFITYS